MKNIIIAGFVLLIISITTNTVYACSGYTPYNLESSINKDIVVEARIVQVDDSGFNAVLQVENYWQGTGERFIVLKRYSPTLQFVNRVRGYDTGCLYNGGGTRWHIGQNGYFALNAQADDGTYTDNASSYGSSSSYTVIDNQILFRDGYSDSEILSVEEFEVLLAETLGVEEAIPVPENSDIRDYPMLRPVMITTENGTLYQINVDRSIREITSTSDDFIASSPDGSHIAIRVDDESIHFNYPYRRLHDDPEIPVRNVVNGEHVSFSPDSNLVAVWDTDSLTIYRLNNRGRGNNGFGMNIVVEGTTSISLDNTDNLDILWSENSASLAFNDGTDIWVWRFNMSDSPEKIYSDIQQFNRINSVEADNTQLMDVSFTGHYVQFGNSTTWTLLDTATGEEYQDMFITPDESLFLSLQYKDNLLDTVEDILWINDNAYALITCEDNHSLCRYIPGNWNSSIQDRYPPQSIDFNGFIDVDYDPMFHNIAFAYDNYQIQIGTEYYANIINLENSLDSPIVSIEWGASVFYIRD